MEDITKGWSCLSLSGSEGDGFRLSNEMGFVEFILDAKFFTKRVLDSDAKARNFKQLWWFKNGFKIKDLGNHIVLFIFDNKLETDRVLESQPWNFDKHLVAIQRYEKTMHVWDFSLIWFFFGFKFTTFPLGFMNQDVAVCICSGIGKVCSLEKSKMEGGDFMRVREEIDVSKPPCRSHKITMDDGINGWVSFKFERLPNICYWCGCLIHNDKDCGLQFDGEGTLSIESRQYGAWMCAPPFNLVKKSMIVVHDFMQNIR